MFLDTLERAGLHAEVTHHNFDPLDPFYYTDDPSAGSTFSGFPIGADAALRVSTVFACNARIAETIATLPCHVMRRTDDEGGQEKARDHRWYHALRYRPHLTTPAVNWYANGQMDLGMRGNALFEISDNGREPSSLRPLNAVTTHVEEMGSGRLRYRHWNHKTGKEEIFLQDEVLHVRDLSFNGDPTGRARASLAREAIAVAAAGEAFVGGFFKNDATGRLVFTHPGHLDKEKREEFLSHVHKNWSGWQNRAKPMLTWGGVDMKEIGLRGESDFIVNPRQFQVADIARFWGVPLYMIGLEEKSTSWGTGIEEQKNAFITFVITAWAERWAQAMMLALFHEDEQDEYTIEFNFDALERGNLLNRMKAHEIGIRTGIINPNEARRTEGRNEREGGDKYNTTLPGTAAPSSLPPPTKPTEDGTETTSRAVPAPLLLDAAQRIASHQTSEVERHAHKADADPLKWTAWVAKHCRAQSEYVTKVVAPLAAAYDFDAGACAAIAVDVQTSALAALVDGAPTPSWILNRATEVAGILEAHLGERTL